MLTHAPYEPTPDGSRAAVPETAGDRGASRAAQGAAHLPDMVAYLEAEGVRDNTLMLFTGYNGLGK